jgi:Zn-dependent peptidase ImmA (M78 family)
MSKHLEPIAELLDSNLLEKLPLEIFGIEPASFLDLMSSAPTKLSAFISTVAEISRHLDFDIQKFYLAVMRSYQEMYDNYFPDIEAFAIQFLAQNSSNASLSEPFISASFLEQCLVKNYQYQIEEFDENSYPALMSLRSVFLPKENKLLINKHLSTEQRAFTFGRELGYQFMHIENRPLMSSSFEADSFEQVFNNFRASYFAGAVLINRQLLINEIEILFAKPNWDNALFLNMLQKFNTTPERFLLRMTTVLPSHFGIQQLFFLRFNQIEGIDFFAVEKKCTSPVAIAHMALPCVNIIVGDGRR